MVLWSDLARLIASNSEREFRVCNPSVRESGSTERFPLPSLVLTEEKQQEPQEPQEPQEQQEQEEDLPPPPPLKRTGSRGGTDVPTRTSSAQPVVARPVVVTRPVVVARPVVPRPIIPTLETLKYPIDPIILGNELANPMYLAAPGRTRHQMELEEAQRIEGILNDLYKSQGGRSRGWTKVGLEAMIKPRCASGGDLKEIDRAKKAFLWPLVVDDKATAAFLDFLCVAKGIRVAVWFDETKQVVLYPASDNPDTATPIPLYHVTAKGYPRMGLPTCTDLMTYCDSNSFVLMPPNSVLHSLEGLTIPDLESVGTKLGMTDITGNKATRVAKIAVFKLRQRLTFS